MNELLSIFLGICDNFDSLLDACTKILEIIGGCAAISAIIPAKISSLPNKGKNGVVNLRKLINILIGIYNVLGSTVNLGGLNVWFAKNKSTDKE
ncbi:MAG: hypothetical protein J6X75_00775 [Clostridia bacterium]|nr:hypothetical protein [Clostridia bacterium]